MLWSLNTSEAVSAIIKQSYKQSRHDDDLNQPLSVQPWGRDSDKRRYWLIEGRDDTSFRLYRENNPALKTSVWISVGGSIEELRGQAMKLAEEGTQASRRLSDRILAAIPRFEATEEVFKPSLSCAWEDANIFVETSPSRIPSRTKGTVQPTRARFLPLRRSHKRQAHEIYVL